MATIDKNFLDLQGLTSYNNKIKELLNNKVDTIQTANIAYGTCSTAADTAQKSVTLSAKTGWKLEVGAIIVVKFTNTNTANNPTLKVGSADAKSIWYNTAVITTSNLNRAGYANRYVKYMYDGTNYVWIGQSIDDNTTYTPPKLGIGYGTCSTSSGTAYTASMTDYNLVTGGIVTIKFSNDVPANATLNINSKGVKSIYHKGSAIAANVIKAGDYATFIYSTQYHLIAIDRTATADISGKADKVSSATNGNFAGLDSNGNLIDSGKKASDFQTTLTFDNMPTDGSNNPVKSDGVYEGDKATYAASESLLRDTVGWTGKNKCPYMRNGTNNGVTYVIDENGVVDADGTASNNDAQTFATFISPVDKVFILSGCNSGDSNIHLYAFDDTTNARPYTDQTKTQSQTNNVYNGNEVQFLAEAGHITRISFRVKSGKTVNHFKAYPMVRDASIADPTYEPYHESVINTLRDAEVIEGKNKLPLTLKKIQSANTTTGTWSGNTFVWRGITFTINTDNNGNVVNIVASGTASETVELNLLPNNTFYLPNGSYILSGGVTYDARIFYFNGTSYYNSRPDEVNFDVSGNESNTRYTIVITSGTTVNNAVFKPMIRKATETDPTYEPYYIPLKESKFDRAEQAVLGAKNLLENTATTRTSNGVTFTVNADGTVTANGTATNAMWITLHEYNGLPVGKYIMSGCPSGGGINTYRMKFRTPALDESINVDDVGDGCIIDITPSLSEKTLLVMVGVASGITVSNLVFKPMLRLASDPDDTYVPYAMTNRELTTDKVNVSQTGNVAYGTCSTAAATAQKDVIISVKTGWKLEVGAIIVVKFTNTNTANNPTLKVGSTDAKPIWYNTEVITTSSLNKAGYANRNIAFMYDGTNWIWINWGTDDNTTDPISFGFCYGTCSTAAATTAKTVSISNYTLKTNGIVSIKFTNSIPASATLNINSRGAKAIYYKGSAITANIVKAGETATFIYDGSHYNLIAIDRIQPTISGNALLF